MATTKLTFKAEKDNSITLVYKAADGNIIDLTGASAKLVIRRGYFQPKVIDNTASINAGAGEMIFNLTALEMTDILSGDSPSETFVGDVELTLASGKVFDLFDNLEVTIKQSAVSTLP